MSSASAAGPAIVELRRCANEFRAGIVRAILEDAGIEARIGTTERTLPGVFGLTGSLEAVVLVRAEDAERAEAVLAARREESIDIDWDEVDVGAPEDGLARRVAGGALEVRERGGWWRGGLQAGVVLAIAAIVVYPFKPVFAQVFALAAIFAVAGSLGSKMFSRAGRRSGDEDGEGRRDSAGAEGDGAPGEPENIK